MQDIDSYLDAKQESLRNYQSDKASTGKLPDRSVEREFKIPLWPVYNSLQP